MSTNQNPEPAALEASEVLLHLNVTLPDALIPPATDPDWQTKLTEVVVRYLAATGQSWVDLVVMVDVMGPAA